MKTGTGVRRCISSDPPGVVGVVTAGKYRSTMAEPGDREPMPPVAGPGTGDGGGAARSVCATPPRRYCVSCGAPTIAGRCPSCEEPEAATADAVTDPAPAHQPLQQPTQRRSARPVLQVLLAVLLVGALVVAAVAWARVEGLGDEVAAPPGVASATFTGTRAPDVDGASTCWVTRSQPTGPPARTLAMAAGSCESSQGMPLPSGSMCSGWPSRYQ
jgi:hypothetical protein